MFDVSWSDPERETVGQRKERKEREASGLQSSGSSIRSSKSSKSNDSQARQATRVSLLTFLNGSRKDLTTSNKKDSLRRSNSSSKQHARVPRPESDDSRRYSCFTEKTETSIQDSLQDDLSDPSTPRAVGDGYYMTAPDNHRHDNRLSIQSSPTNDGSIFSGRTGRSFATTTSWGSVIESSRKPSLVQPLSPKSFVTQTTEVTVSSTDSSTHSHSGEEHVATYVHISSHGNHPIEVNRPSSRLSTSPAPFDGGNGHGSSETLSIAEEEALLELRNWPNWKPPESWDNGEVQTLPALPTIPSRSTLPSPTPISPISPSSILQTYSTFPPLSPPPPSSPLPSLPRHSLSTSTKRSRRKVAKSKDIATSSTHSSELSHFQKSIRLKEAATPKIMLERLKEEWMVNADASMYRELELEKQLWMLTALRAEYRDHEMHETLYEDKGLIESKSSSIASRFEKVLSLYENHASASFLSALNPTSELHHLSISPITSAHLPTTNLHPLYTPSHTPVLPYPPSTFTQIHSFPLSSGLLPSSSIPQILHEIHRCLLNTGKLHLTIIDPSPSPSTTGPRLREWLEMHLITNLERQFRCLNPSRLFPLWLSDAGLRAEGSTIQKLRFRAVVDGDGSVVGVGGECHGMGVGEELRSVVGRMLWREMWGSWVEGERWWWECSEIVEECRRMGTAWEYFVIEAVKEP